MDTVLAIVLGSITTAIAALGRRTDNRSKKIVKALKISSAAITEAMMSDEQV